MPAITKKTVKKSSKSSKPKIKVSKSPKITGGYEVPDGFVKELNFFDMTGKKANTKGTSNKFFHLEMHISKGGDYEIYTEYGATGSSNPAKDYRYFGGDSNAAESEFTKLFKSKVKKGYKEIDVAQRAHGSDEAKKHTKAVIFKNATIPPNTSKHTLTNGQQSIVQLLFKAQDTWVAQTLKCPLGQLTNNQIDLGRAALDRAKLIVNSTKHLDKNQINDIDDITNEFYGLIPHNFGSGSRGQLTHLRLDTLDKIVGKESDLDTLLDAKQVGAVLKTDSTAYDKYKSLNCDFDELDTESELFKYLVSYFKNTKLNAHGYHGAKITRIWSMNRKDSKEDAFLINSEKIAGQAGFHTFEKETINTSKGLSKNWVPNKRPDLNKDKIKLFEKANVWLCWHGTRSANLLGITRRGLLIRPSGAVHTGSLYGDGKYSSWISTKSLGYSDGGYWTGGNKNNTKYMFLLNIAFGKMHKQSSPKFFSRAPQGYHSVYSKGGGYVKNDEMITYDKDDKDNQSNICYLCEIRQ